MVVPGLDAESRLVLALAKNCTAPSCVGLLPWQLGPGVELIAARQGFVSELPRWYSGQQRANLGDDLTDRGRTFNDVESERSDLIAGQTAERGHDENSLGRHCEAHCFQRFARLGQFAQIDQQYARRHARATVEWRNRPGVNGNDLVAFLDQLSAQESALGPLRVEYR